MIQDEVRVTHSVDVEEPGNYRSHVHYDVEFGRRAAVAEHAQGERITFSIRANGIERVRFDMPGPVGRAMLYAVREAFQTFKIEETTQGVKK